MFEVVLTVRVEENRKTFHYNMVWEEFAAILNVVTILQNKEADMNFWDTQIHTFCRMWVESIYNSFTGSQKIVRLYNGIEGGGDFWEYFRDVALFHI